jgi:hypothetical protein
MKERNEERIRISYFFNLILIYIFVREEKTSFTMKLFWSFRKECFGVLEKSVWRKKMTDATKI